MRKKELLLQNTQLFDKITMYEMQISKLKQELAKKNAEIEELNKKIDGISESKEEPKPFEKLEEKVMKLASSKKQFDYGAQVIGKIVVAGARYCNRLTDNSSLANAKELMNLILGRTEVAKSEILKIVSSGYDEELKKEKIDAEYEKAVDYFDSVMAQNNE